VDATGHSQRQFDNDKWMEELEALYDSCGEPLYSYLLALLCSPEEAEDALQELFARLLLRSRRLARLKDAEAYLFRAARNEAFSRLRRRDVRERGQESLRQTQRVLEAAPGQQLSQEEVDRVNAAVQQLPPGQREVIVLKLFHGMTFREIGTVVGISPNTAASRYRYALNKLKLLIGEEKMDESRPG